MPSEFETLAAAFAGPSLMSHHAEKAGLRIETPSGQAVVDAIIRRPVITIDQDIDTGEMRRVERRTVEVGSLPYPLTQQTTFTIMATGERWNWDQDETRLGGSPVTVGLVRKPLVRHPEPRRGNFV